MQRIFVSLLLFCATFVLAPLAASAAPITVPSGLNPGDQYRLAFVTSTTRDALSPNIADYNAFVTTAASSVPELAALGTTWKAIGSTSTIDARDNTGTNPSSTGVPIYRLDDSRIANNNVDLWDASLILPLNTMYGGLPGGGPGAVWTGSLTDGTKAPLAYLGEPGAGGGPRIGQFFLQDFRWISDGSHFRSTLNHFYAMSDVLTVVPEPSTMVLAGFGVVGLLLAARRRQSSRD